MGVRGRQPLCLCGECQRCKHRVRMREFRKRVNQDKYRPSKEVRAAYMQQVREKQGKEEYNRVNRARNAVYRAVKRGELIRGNCEMEDENCLGRIEAHHEDYDKPLEVRWLCVHHHSEVDR